MAALCKGLQRLQRSPDLHTTCMNILRQDQHLLLARTMGNQCMLVPRLLKDVSSI